MLSPFVQPHWNEGPGSLTQGYAVSVTGKQELSFRVFFNASKWNFVWLTASAIFVLLLSFFLFSVSRMSFYFIPPRWSLNQFSFRLIWYWGQSFLNKRTFPHLSTIFTLSQFWLLICIKPLPSLGRLEHVTPVMSRGKGERERGLGILISFCRIQYSAPVLFTDTVPIGCLSSRGDCNRAQTMSYCKRQLHFVSSNPGDAWNSARMYF